MTFWSFAHFLFFSLALGNGHNWALPRSDWEAQHASPLPSRQPAYGHNGSPNGWRVSHGGWSAVSGSSTSSPCPEPTRSVARPSMPFGKPAPPALSPSVLPSGLSPSLPPTPKSTPPQASCPPHQTPSVNIGPTATLDCGVVIGTTTSLPAATATVNKFLGIPFAQSPPQRFGMPQAPGSCNVNATAWKPACIQQFVGSTLVRDFTEYVFNNPAPEESEDCMYLNVYAPSSPPPAGGRTVMFWIYGGALEFGNAGQIYYDGSYFAAHEDVIIVTTNYRTNVSNIESDRKYHELTSAYLPGLWICDLTRDTHNTTKPWILRSTLRIRMGSKEHCSIWWLSRKSDDIRRVGWRFLCRCTSHLVPGQQQTSVQSGCHGERTDQLQCRKETEHRASVEHSRWPARMSWKLH